MAVDSKGDCDNCGRSGVAYFTSCPECGTPTDDTKQSASSGDAGRARLRQLEEANLDWLISVSKWRKEWWPEFLSAEKRKQIQARVEFLDRFERQVERDGELDDAKDNPAVLSVLKAQRAEVHRLSSGKASDYSTWDGVRARRQWLENAEERLAAWQDDCQRQQQVAEDLEAVGLSQLRLLERNVHAVVEDLDLFLREGPRERMRNPEATAARHPDAMLAVSLGEQCEQLITQQRSLLRRIADRVVRLATLVEVAEAIEEECGNPDWAAVHQPEIRDLVTAWRKRVPDAPEEWRKILPHWHIAARRYRVAATVARNRGDVTEPSTSVGTPDSEDLATLRACGLQRLDPAQLIAQEEQPALIALAGAFWVKETAVLLVEVPRALMRFNGPGSPQVFLDITSHVLYATPDRRIGRSLVREPFANVVEGARYALTSFYRRRAANAPPAAVAPRIQEVRVRGLTDDQQRAVSLVDSDEGVVYITGEAGTGKSFALDKLRESAVNTLVAAPTSLAAQAATGVTVHKLLGAGEAFVRGEGLDPLTNVQRKVLQRAERVIVDEVSMLRADLLDAMDQRFREARRSDLPFGGVQVVLFGDLMQLPPVVTDADKTMLDHRGYASPYFFSAHALDGHYRRADRSWALELLTQHRQEDDPVFARLLGRLRRARQTDADLALLNDRVIDVREVSRTATILCARNRDANAINDQKLSKLKGEEGLFHGQGSWPGVTPVERTVRVRRGARVVLMRNDPNNLYANGSQGTIVSWNAESVMVELDKNERLGMSERVVTVGKTKWERYEAYVDPEADEIAYREIGYFKQIPIRLSWALTIHKAQGMTLTDVAVDLGAGAFASGQTYVALSRVKTLNGLVFLRPLDHRDIWVDPVLHDFHAALRDP